MTYAAAPACSVPTVRLVDADKEMLGVFSRDDALKKAEEAGLDLVRRTTHDAIRDRACDVAACAHARAVLIRHR